MCGTLPVQGPEASSHAHEAGYDAYMTGAAFACLMRLHEAAASSPGQALPSPQQQPSLNAVQHLLGRMNVGRWAAGMFPVQYTFCNDSVAMVLRYK